MTINQLSFLFGVISVVDFFMFVCFYKKLCCLVIVEK